MNTDSSFWARLRRFIDPTRQSPLAFTWTWTSVLGVLGAAWLLYLWRDAWGVNGLFDNVFIQLPTHLIHEFAHRIGWSLSHSQTVSLWAGPMTEMWLPGVLLWLSWRLSGGRWISCILWYYWGTCWYSTARYCADARAMTLHLASSDLVSTSGPGTPGDWYYMLGGLGWLEWDTRLAAVFYFLGALCVTLAFYSVWYYWTHLNEFIRRDLKPDPWSSVPPSVAPPKARITAEDYERDPFTGERFRKPWDPYQAPPRKK